MYIFGHVAGGEGRGVDAVKARGLVSGRLSGAWKFTPHARVMYLENKRVHARIMQVLINGARSKRAIDFGEGRGLALPFGAHHVDGGVRNA
jgi:hypothetical protein